MNIEMFNDTIDKIRGNIGADLSATNSEGFLAVVGAYQELSTNYEDSKNEIEKLTQKNKELLETNGRLFQRIGFEKATYNETSSNKDEHNEEEKIKLTDIINEKGELI